MLNREATDIPLLALSDATLYGDSIDLRKVQERKKLDQLQVVDKRKGRLSVHGSLLTASYEETLFRSMPIGHRIPLTAQLTVSRYSERKGTISIMQSQTLLLEGFTSNDPSLGISCPIRCRYQLIKSIILPHKGTLQLVLRDSLGTIGKIFLLRLDLSDMPRNSQTIIRQKHYYVNSLDDQPKLQHGLQLSIRKEQSLSSATTIPYYDSNGNLQYRALTRLSVEQTLLYGSLRIIFSFNQAATIGKNHREDNHMREQLHIVTEYPIDGKYISSGNSTALSRSDKERRSPLGSVL